MKRTTLVLAGVLLLAAGCARPAPARNSPQTTPTASSTPEAGPSATSSSATGSGAASGPAFTVTYDWNVPSREVRVEHRVDVPPVPELVEVRTGDHPEGGFARITFAFRDAFPAYHFQYVREIVSDGEGAPIALPGNGFLTIVFTPARSNASNGGVQRVGYRNLVSYVRAGNYEGYVTYGIGISVAPGSDQVLPVRVGELTRPDGSHVVAVDIKNG